MDPISSTINWNSVFLKQNPFPSTPPKNPEAAVWAGFSSLRGQLKSVFDEALSTDRTQVVLNWGEYGSGKTHAATYYQLQSNFVLESKSLLRDLEIIYIQTPREPEKADILLYRNILEAIKFKRIRLAVRNIIKELGDAETLKYLQEIVASEVLGKSIWLLGQNRTKSGQLALFEDNTPSSEWDLLLETYFYSQTTKSELKKLGLSRGVDSANDRYRLLGGILTILIGAGSIEKLSEHSRVILWIDEMENLIYFTSRYYLPFTQGLRELIDQIPNYFTLFMNITLASPEASKDIETILGKALMDRKTNEIYFKEPNEEEAYNYVIELLELYRTPEWKPKSLEPSHPFTKEALQILISSLKVRTPRDINQYCSDAITGALRDRVVGQNEQTITRQYIIDWIDKRTQQSL